MVAYYFYQADVKNWLWTVIFSIILTDDRFLSLGFHCVCIGGKRKTDVVNVWISFFSSLVEFLCLVSKKDILLLESKNLREYILVLKAQTNMNNFYVVGLSSGVIVYVWAH